MLLRLAVRNLVRNTRRTAITVAGIALGLALMVLANNIANYSHQDMLRTATGLLAGDVVVQEQGYQADPKDDTVVADSKSVADALAKAIPNAIITRRLAVQGLITSPTNSVGVMLRGVEPGVEAQVIDLDNKLVDGEWLSPDDPQGIVMGHAMVDSLGIAVGDKVVFMGQPEGSEVQSRLFRLRGVYATGAAELDGFVAIVPLAAAQSLYTTADPATQIAIHLPDAHHTDVALAAAKAAVTRPDVEILGWEDAIPDIRDFVHLDSAYGDGIWAVLGVIVAMGVVNTVLMSVMERVREFGVMMAVGMRPARLAGLILTEGVVLGVVGAALGLFLGLVTTAAVAHWGIDLSGDVGSSMEAAGVPLSMKLYAEVDYGRLGLYPVIGVGFALIASLWPAWRVMRLQPVQAIRHQ